MRLVQLEYFIKIAECGSITKAAQELYVSQPSLTKAIASLEAEYDIKLLERTSKGVRMTPRGSEFLEYAKDVIDSSRKLEDTFGKKDFVPIQRLCIASQQFDFLYDLLEEVCREHKMMINVMMAEVDRGTVLKRVKGRTADIGILILTDSDKKEFEQEIKKMLWKSMKWLIPGFMSAWHPAPLSITEPRSNVPKSPIISMLLWIWMIR